MKTIVINNSWKFVFILLFAGIVVSLILWFFMNYYTQEQNRAGIRDHIQIGTKMNHEDGYMIDAGVDFPHDKPLLATFSIKPTSESHDLLFEITDTQTDRVMWEKDMTEPATPTYSGTYFKIENEIWGKEGRYKAMLFVDGKLYTKLDFLLR